MKLKVALFALILFAFTLSSYAQDTVLVPAKTLTVATTPKDSVAKKQPHSPRKATIRSAIIPGWGQIYNKKYWKVPIVYGAIGTTVGIFTYNLKWYNRTRYAYKIAYQIAQGQGNAGQDKVYSELVPLLNYPESLRQYRNEFRQNVDYSVLFFLLAWGLNVVDATVDGHLKDFDVSQDLSMRFQPGYSPLANTTGLSLIVSIGNKKPSKNLSSLR